MITRSPENSPNLIPLLALCVFCLSAPALAEEVVKYPGTPLQDAWLDYLAPSGGGNSNSLSGNTVTVNSGAIPGNVYGARNSNTGDVTSNKVFINDGEVGSDVYGGESYSGSATGNSVTISDGVVKGSIWGGRSETGSVTGNSVTINDGEVKGSIGGGNSPYGSVIGNSVTISGGVVGGPIWGGNNSETTGSVTGNSVTISGGTFSGSFILGGNSRYNTATDNTVTISGTPVGLNAMTVWGGNSLATGKDAFTGNILNKDSDVGIGTARNFEFVNFGYDGAANIGTLDTTPTGATGSLVKLNTNSYNVSFNGLLTGNGGIVKQGDGTLTLTGMNTYKGGTTVSAGTLAGNTNSLQGDIENNAAVTFGQTGDGAYTGVMSGSGSLTKSGAGTLTLSGANAYGGGTTVSGGLINFSGSGNFGTGQITLDGGGLQWATGNTTDISAKLNAIGAGGGTFDTNGENVTLASALTGEGGVTKSGTGTLTLSGTNSYTGGTTVSGGLINFSAAANFGTGQITLDGGGLQWATGNTTDISAKLNAIGAGGGTFDTNGNDATLESALSGDGGIVKQGSGILTLSAENSYSGATTVSAGTLKGNIAPDTDLTVEYGATYDGMGAARSVRALSGAGYVVNDGGLTVQSGAFSGVLSGSGDLTKTGAGTLTLSGTNSYSGLTTVQSGTLALGSALTSSRDLALSGNAIFQTNGNSHSLDNGSLTVRGENAIYDGNLSAMGATLNFIAPVTVSQTLLTVTGTANISDSSVNVGLSGGTSLPVGTKLSLLKTTDPNDLTADNLSAGSGIAEDGVTTIHTLALSLDPLTGALTATVTSGNASERSKALSEGFISGIGLITQGADHVAGEGMAAAVESARAAGRAGASRAGYGLAAFGSLSGGALRYNSGSHVDMHSASLVAGFTSGSELTPGRLTLGAFFEYGNGSYDTYNSFANASSVHGDGNMDHTGGGILGRMDFINTGPGRFYAEASARAGRVHNEYDSSDLRDRSSGRKAEYDSSSAYHGFHLGGGYVWKITDTASLDLYGKYFWTRQEGDSVTLSTGGRVKFENVDSSRLRLGGRFSHVVNKYFGTYVGAAWEHESDGRARATTNGHSIKAPSLRGDTGIGELGFTFTPTPRLPLTVDFGVQGYAGKRRGLTGTLQVRFEF